MKIKIMFFVPQRYRNQMPLLNRTFPEVNHHFRQNLVGSCNSYESIRLFRVNKSFLLRLSEKPSAPSASTDSLTATSSSQSQPQVSQPPLPPKKRKPVSAYLFSRFFTFVESYPAKLEKNFPGAMHVYRVFVVGFKVRNLHDMEINK